MIKSHPFHNKVEHVKYAASLIDKNYDSYSQYIDVHYSLFNELEQTSFQIAKTLMYELHAAAITLTNHLLERLMKMSLIHKAAGISAIPTETLTAVYEPLDKKYGSMNLATSIDHCKKEGLITQQERDMLYNTIREFMRNGFSHADVGVVLQSIKPEIKLHQFSFTDPTYKAEFITNRKVMPVFQSIDMESFAKENAANYYRYVFELMDRIGDRLIEMEKVKSTTK